MTPGDPRHHLGARRTKTVLAINNYLHATGVGVFHYGEIMTEKNKLTHVPPSLSGLFPLSDP